MYVRNNITIYLEYMRRETIEPYPLHHLVARLLWIPAIIKMSTTDDYRVRYIFFFEKIIKAWLM